jgi:hypothetical protein
LRGRVAAALEDAKHRLDLDKVTTALLATPGGAAANHSPKLSRLSSQSRQSQQRSSQARMSIQSIQSQQSQQSPQRQESAAGDEAVWLRHLSMSLLAVQTEIDEGLQRAGRDPNALTTQTKDRTRPNAAPVGGAEAFPSRSSPSRSPSAAAGGSPETAVGAHRGYSMGNPSTATDAGGPPVAVVATAVPVAIPVDAVGGGGGGGDSTAPRHSTGGRSARSSNSSGKFHRATQGSSPMKGLTADVPALPVGLLNSVDPIA